MLMLQLPQGRGMLPPPILLLSKPAGEPSTLGQKAGDQPEDLVGPLAATDCPSLRPRLQHEMLAEPMPTERSEQLRQLLCNKVPLLDPGLTGQETAMRPELSSHLPGTESPTRPSDEAGGTDTWAPAKAMLLETIQGMPLDHLHLSSKRRSPCWLPSLSMSPDHWNSTFSTSWTTPASQKARSTGEPALRGRSLRPLQRFEGAGADCELAAALRPDLIGLSVPRVQSTPKQREQFPSECLIGSDVLLRLRTRLSPNWTVAAAATIPTLMSPTRRTSELEVQAYVGGCADDDGASLDCDDPYGLSDERWCNQGEAHGSRQLCDASWPEELGECDNRKVITPLEYESGLGESRAKVHPFFWQPWTHDCCQ